MSYQAFLKSTAGSINTSPSPGSIHRKPPPYATTPVKNYAASFQSTASKNAAAVSNNTPSASPALSGNPAASSPVPTPAPQPAVNIHTREPTRNNISKEQIDAAMQTCLDLQKTASTIHDKRPFAALLLAPDNSTVLLTHFSISHVQHAETELARLASIHFSERYLAACTLVSTWEPCAMCTGTLYWSNIGRLLYAAAEEKLKDLTGGNNEENMTMSLPCRDVLKAGQKDVEVIGPISEWEAKVVEESSKWWKDHQSKTTVDKVRNGSLHGSERAGSLSSLSMRHGTPTTWTGEENVLSRIDDEGEYKAELDIDWMR
jgi:tRNA(Arg) A34 adenosine deaminase TadA